MEDTKLLHRILVVDDDPGIRLLIRAALPAADFLVFEANNGEAAIADFLTHSPDAVLLDVSMPGMNGFDCCRKLRELPKGKECAIVMVTGLDKPNDIRLAFEAGATDFLTKPFNLQLFNHRLRYLLKSHTNLLELKRKQRQLAKAQSIAKLGYWEWNFNTPFITCSEEAYRILELPPRSNVSYASALRLLVPQDRALLRNALRTALRTQQPYDIEYRIQLNNGTVKSLNDRVEISCEHGEYSLIGTIHDISARKVIEEKISYYAYYDALTNLPNRPAFIRHFETALASASQNNTPLALLFIDLDRFKQVNDTYGHTIGDKVLCKTAERIMQRLCGTDSKQVRFANSEVYVARLAGDEFIVLLSEQNAALEARMIAKALLEECVKPFVYKEYEIYLSASIGISIYPDDGTDARSLLQQADLAMYHAKESGRNNFKHFSTQLIHNQFSRLNLESEMRKALERNEFRLFFQPQLDVAIRLIGCEALLRWQHPEKGLLAPDGFINIAESSGLIVPIGNWVLNEACRQAVAWQGLTGERIPVSVNLSAMQFNSSLPELVMKALQQSTLDPELLELEITETAMIKNIDETFKLLMSLKDMGVKLSIDDFGTGYSSLNYLKNFPIDTLKIDKSFMDGVQTDSKEAAIVRTILQLSQNLGISAIAEGVETQQQFDLLVEMGCAKFQGYFFSKPLPAHLLLEYFADLPLTIPELANG